jgi:large subunit ribosomal protein L31
MTETKKKKGENKSKVSAQIEKVSAVKNTKATMHPKYREITIEMTDGTKFATRSTYHADCLKLDIDPKTHPAWTKEANYVNAKATEVAKFNNKFKGLNFGSARKN